MSATVYAHFDALGACLYVGMTGNPVKRAYQHSVTAAWWPEVASSKEVETATRDEAVTLERRWITELAPIHNRYGRPAKIAEGTPSASRGVAAEVSRLLGMAGISRVEAANRSGISPTTLDRRLTGHSPFTVPELDVLAALLGVTVSDLFTKAAA